LRLKRSLLRPPWNHELQYFVAEKLGEGAKKEIGGLSGRGFAVNDSLQRRIPMKICTLIVRLVGLALVVRSITALIELSSLSGRMQAGFGGASLRITGMDPSGQITRMYIYIAFGILAGLVCTVFAPWVARLLTFDAPEDKPAELPQARSGPETSLAHSGGSEGPPLAG